MTLEDLYQKIPSANHQNIRVIKDTVIYDNGVTIATFMRDSQDNLIPLNNESKSVLAGLE